MAERQKKDIKVRSGYEQQDSAKDRTGQGSAEKKVTRPKYHSWTTEE